MILTIFAIIGLIFTTSYKTKTAQAYTNGALVKAINDPNIYVIQSGEKGELKVWVRSINVFNNCGYNWTNVQNVASINYLPRTANLIKKADNPDVYRLEKNFKRKFCSAAVLDSYSLHWEDIATVCPAVLDSYSTAPLLADGTMIYKVGSDFVRHLYNNMATFYADGMSTKDIIYANQSEIFSYDSGVGMPNTSQPAQPSITVLSPNGGETLISGNSSDVSIKWQSTNIDKVDIRLFAYSRSNAATTKIIAENLDARSGVYYWSAPDLANIFDKYFKAGSNYKIVITEKYSNGNFGVQDESDSFFTISSSVFSIPLKGTDPAFFMEFSESITVATSNPSILLLGEANIYQNKDDKNGWLKITTGFSFACKQLGKKDVYRVIEIKTHAKGSYALNLRVVRVSVGSCSVWGTTDGKSMRHFVQITPEQSAQGAPSKMAKNGATTWGKIKS